MAGLQTEFSFTLPKGYIDRQGTLHRYGTMRLATARDEMEPLRDPRVQGPDDPYLTILVLSRVLTELGTLAQVQPDDVENLFAADIAFLQDLYGIINFGNPADVAVLQRSVLPEPEAPGDPDALWSAAPDDTFDEAGLEAPSVADVHPLEPAAPLRRRDRIEEVQRAADR